MTKINSFFKFPRALLDYSSSKLTKLDGKQVIQSGRWGNIEFSGQAILGTKKEKTHFSGIIVANGDLTADNCEFETLDVRGSFKVNDCVMRKGLFCGQGWIRSIQADALHVQSPGGSISVSNSTIRGDLDFRKIGYRPGRMTLENTTVTGYVITDPGASKSVIIINSPGVRLKEEAPNNQGES